MGAPKNKTSVNETGPNNCARCVAARAQTANDILGRRIQFVHLNLCSNLSLSEQARKARRNDANTQTMTRL